METQPKREEIPPISLERRLSRDQEAEIDACYELLSSGRPVSEVLEEMRRIGKGGKVSNATLAIKLAEVCEQLDKTAATPGSIEPSDQIDAPSTPIFEPPRDFAEASRSKFRRLVWVGFIGCFAASSVTFAGIVSVGQLPAVPTAPPPICHGSGTRTNQVGSNDSCSGARTNQTGFNDICDGDSDARESWRSPPGEVRCVLGEALFRARGPGRRCASRNTACRHL